MHSCRITMTTGTRALSLSAETNLSLATIVSLHGEQLNMFMFSNETPSLLCLNMVPMRRGLSAVHKAVYEAVSILERTLIWRHQFTSL